MAELWAIVLAAGASTRMKTQKMLLPYNGKTVIDTVLQTAKETLGGNVITVIGSSSEEILPIAKKMEVGYCINSDYMAGMLSSVICGFSALPGEAEAALILLGDQPQLKEEVIRLVADAWRKSGKGIVIPVYDGHRWHPVLIETRFRKDISALDPDQGLRGLLKKYPAEICGIECGTADILRDIDTPEDYEKEINLSEYTIVNC